MKSLLLLTTFVLLATPAVFARTWTSTDGTALEAEFVSATGTHVTIRRESDGKRFTLPLERLSAPDRDWVAAQSEGGSGDEDGISLPKEAAMLVADHGTVLFEDDFNREDAADVDDLGEHWQTNSASRAKGDKQTDLVEGVLVMTISPQADHAISVVHNTAEPYQDAVTYVKIKLEDGEQLKLAFNDREYEPVHAGHINGATFTPEKLLLADEREGRFSAKATELKEAGKTDELSELNAQYEKSFPLDMETGEWHDVVVVHRGGVMTAFIDGKDVGSYESPGFAHPTKRQFVFAVPKRASVDHLKVWILKTE